MKHNENKNEEKPLSIAQRLLQKRGMYNPYYRDKELRTAAGRRLHNLNAEIIKEEEDARETHSKTKKNG